MVLDLDIEALDSIIREAIGGASISEAERAELLDCMTPKDLATATALALQHPGRARLVPASSEAEAIEAVAA